MKEEHNPTPDYEETTFIGLWKKDKLEPFCLPFWLSILAVSFVIVYECHYGDQQITKNISALSNDLFSLAVSSLGINLAALAVVLVIYNDDKIKLKSFKDGAYQQFLFPYYINAYSWTLLSILSLITTVIDKTVLIQRYEHLTRILSYFLLFLLVYSIMYTIRLIGSIISNSILSIFIE